MSNINILFSIILAVRNKENYIKRTINSCINQTLSKSKYEIIIINDASTDKTKKNIKSKIKNFKNYTLINLKKKMGPGIARNYGLRYAAGKYIIFVDGDDQLQNNTLKIISKKLILNPDIVTFNFNKIFNKKKINHARKDFLKITNNKIKLINNFLSGEIDGSVIFTCFKKNLIFKNNIKFPKGLHEDITFIFQAYILAKKIIKINSCLYIKNEVKNSITSSVNFNRINDLLTVHSKMIRIIKKMHLYKKKMYYYSMRGFIGYASDSIMEVLNNKNLSKSQKNRLIRLIKKKSLNFKEFKKYSYKTKKDIIFKKFISSNIK